MIDTKMKEEVYENEDAAAKAYYSYLSGILKQARKLFSRQRKYMADNNETTQALLLFLKEFPDLFAHNFSVGDREIIKWALGENIKQNRILIDTISGLETGLCLPLEYED